MQIHITIDSTTSPDQISKLTAALQALNGAVPFAPSCGGVEGEAPVPAEVQAQLTKAEPAPKSRAKAKPEPKDEPKAEEAPAEEEKPKGELPKVDYAALRAETRELFAAYAEEAGTTKGLALLQEFDVAKFKDLEDGQLADMRKRLLELGE